MTTALVIGRRRPGRPIEKVVRETQRRLEDAGLTATIAVVDRKRQLRSRAAKSVKSGVDVVVVAGGDGAVLQVVQSLAGASVTLGIVPMGTGNLLAGNLTIPHAFDQAIEVLLTGRRRKIDLGRVRVGDRHRVFSVACGVGFDAEVMRATKPRLKRRWGKLAYVASAIRRSSRVRDVPHVITIDGVERTMAATQVFVANFGRMGLAMKPRLSIEPDDGLLDVIVVKASGRLPGLLAGWEAIRQGQEGESAEGHAFRARAREVTIETDPSRLVEIDGTVVGTTPIKVAVRRLGLEVIVPAEKPEEGMVTEPAEEPADGTVPGPAAESVTGSANVARQAAR